MVYDTNTLIKVFYKEKYLDFTDVSQLKIKERTVRHIISKLKK